MKKINIINHFFLITFTLLCIFIFNINSKAEISEYKIQENFSYTINTLDINDSYLEKKLAGPNDDREVCEEILSNDVIDLLQDVFNIIKFADIILVLVLTIVTFTQAIAKGGDELKKALNVTIKRVIIGVIIFFVPVLIDFIFDAIGLYNTCGIG